MTFFQKLWKAWKRFGQIIGDLVGRIILSIFYFTIFMPFGLGVRLFSDPLKLNFAHHKPQWVERVTKDAVLEDSRRLFE